MVAQGEINSDSAAVDAALIAVTPAAAAQVKLVLEERDRPGAALRIFIAGRTCSGFQYGMALADGPDADDVLIEQHGVRFIVDNVSAPFLSGAAVDFIDTVMQKGFTITNPNATNEDGGGCACGRGGGGCGCGNGGHAH